MVVNEFPLVLLATHWLKSAGGAAVRVCDAFALATNARLFQRRWQVGLITRALRRLEN
jgi:hypothetical protein